MWSSSLLPHALLSWISIKNLVFVTGPYRVDTAGYGIGSAPPSSAKQLDISLLIIAREKHQKFLS